MQDEPGKQCQEPTWSAHIVKDSWRHLVKLQSGAYFPRMKYFDGLKYSQELRNSSISREQQGERETSALPLS